MVIFFFNDTATTEIYTLSLHDALPIFQGLLVASSMSFTSSGIGPPTVPCAASPRDKRGPVPTLLLARERQDRKSTRLNSSHANISYAVFCLKKKTHLYFLLHLHYHHAS